MPEPILQWGIDLILWLQSAGSWPVTPLNAFTFLGNLEFYLLLLPALYWCVDSRLGLRVAIVLMVSIALNSLLKMLLHDPRPYWVDPQVQLLAGPESTFGIPSGHAQNSVVLWGLIAAHFNKKWVWAAAVVLAGLVGFSRIFLGVHFPTDVLAGWVLGCVLLLATLQFEAAFIAWFARRRGWLQLVLVFTVAGVMLGLGVLLQQLVLTSFTLPAAWQQNAAAVAPHHPIDPYSLRDLLLSTTVLAFVSTAAILFKPYHRFYAGGSVWGRLLRFGVGFLITLVVYVAGSALIADGAQVLQLALMVLLLGWVIVLAPLVFVRLNLAAQPVLDKS
jgi:membrane-associated phospholipid phosphatase